MVGFVLVHYSAGRLQARYSCTAEIICQKKGIFLIPLAKRFLFTVGTKLLEDKRSDKN